LAAVVVLWKPLAGTRRLSATLVRSDTAGHATFDEPRRARGGRFPEADARLVRATGTLIHAAELSAEETWFDFANASGLHYLFERDSPTRYLDVPFYESEAAQNEVIAALERDPKVRAVLG